VQVLLDKSAKARATLQRDNDLIYHQDVPTSSTLPPIPTVTLAQSTLPVGLDDPKKTLADRGESAIFGDLASWGVLEAVNVYEDRKKDWIQNEIVSRSQELDLDIDRYI
jgi:programmed cell death 6-interacting protein